MLSDRQLESFSAGELADKRLKKRRMYHNIKTWNPAVGCTHNCIYCKPSFQALIARFMGRNCDGCLKFYPHEHPERLTRIPGRDIIFAFGNGDITFYRESFVEEAIEKLIDNLRRSRKSKTAYFQSAMIGLIGDDAEGAIVRHRFEGANVQTSLLVEKAKKRMPIEVFVIRNGVEKRHQFRPPNCVRILGKKDWQWIKSKLPPARVVSFSRAGKRATELADIVKQNGGVVSYRIGVSLLFTGRV